MALVVVALALIFWQLIKLVDGRREHQRNVAEIVVLLREFNRHIQK
jgi:hypothetical protein